MASLSRAAEKIGDWNRAAEFHRRARNYRLYWDDRAGFFRGRLANGSFRHGFSPSATSDFAEGNAFSYLFMAPHDVAGLIELFGGETAFSKRLEELVTTPMGKVPLNDLSGLIGQYAHGNEHSHHVLYLHAYAGAQWRTAELVQRVMSEFYGAGVEGLIGNDDCGQMSAWYVFSAIGFYPVFPASLEYVFGSPSLESVTLNLENGRAFRVRAVGARNGWRYIQHAQLNGQEYTRSYIHHDTIMAGGELAFVMGPRPNTSFGKRPEDRPRSSFG
jgi:predicted alpha-1,2-mannosidase